MLLEGRRENQDGNNENGVECNVLEAKKKYLTENKKKRKK